MTSSEAQDRFVERIDQHQGILHRICAVYASRAEDRRDLFQEMVLQLWRSHASFEGRSSHATWIYRVALNTALTFRRGKDRRPEREGLEGAEERRTAGGDDGPSDDVEALEAALRELPSLDRALILLRLEERSYAEIAEITGISRANVSVRLVRIKERLRRRLESTLSFGERQNHGSHR